jgi:hypothetical protein
MRPLLIPLCCVLPLASCEKAKELLGKAQETVKANAAPAGAPAKEAETKPAGGEIEPALASQVEKDDAGVRFRKDQPFPTTIEARKVTRITYHQARSVSRSVIGNDIKVIDGTTELVSHWVRSGDRVEVWMEKMGFELPLEKRPKVDPKKPALPLKQEPMPVGRSVTPEQLGQMKGVFVKTGSSWRTESGRGGDFVRAAWLQALEPGFSAAAIEAGVLPRTMWFGGKARWKKGTEVTLEGDHLRVLGGFPKTKGSVRLVFEEVEAVAGHPCGRFSISGDYVCEGRVDDDGTRSDMELSITDGKIWCSLLHPVVMKQELETVMTLSSNANGVPTRIQGKADIATSCEWKSGL